MSNYSKTTDFEAKDSLPTGDSGKIIRGAEFETEFDAISTAIATKADTAGPTFTGTLTFETISDGTIGVTAFVDEDNMASNSATLVPTQQSVKAYVDSQVTAQDLDFQADTGGALSIDLDSETMTFTGGTGIDTSGLGNAVTFAIDSTVATLTGSQTLTNKTLTSPVLNTGVSGTAVLDEDNMASNSATQLATQQSIKAYVDSQVGANNELSEILANGNTTGGTNIVFGDSASVSDDRLVFGAGSDLQIYHSGVHSYIDDAGTGNLTLRGNASVRVEKYEGEILADFAADGAVSLYHDNSVKIATTSTGVNVTGNVAVSGTVDGRDVATDGTKLDGIEAGATADQTAAEIRTLVEAATDSNVFTDADHTKLDGIEAGATGDQTNAEIRAAVEAATDSNVFTDADHSKLDGIEALADVTDTTNVTAAGALMDSELTNITAVKALNQGVATTDTPTFAGLATSANVTFGDNDKAIFGAGSDLQIYHSGTTSFITENGIGDLRIGGNNLLLRSDDIFVQSEDGTANAARFNSTTGVTLYRAGAAKLATTSSGIDVTGTVTADGLTVDGDAAVAGTTGVTADNGTITTGKDSASSRTHWSMNNPNGEVAKWDSNGTDLLHYITDEYKVYTAGNKAFEIDGNGDISFYEDTGTTAKLFWDASAESLGIGTSSPTEALNVKTSSGNSYIDVERATQAQGEVGFKISGGTSGTDWFMYQPSSSNDLRFYKTGDKVTINSSGNVGIGTSSIIAGARLDVRGANSNNLSSLDAQVLTVQDTTSYAANVGGGIAFGYKFNSLDQSIQRGAVIKAVKENATDGDYSTSMAFATVANGGQTTEKMRIDSSGNLLVGTTNSTHHTGSSVQGITLSKTFHGLISASRSGAQPLILNRQTSDGTIADFRKDGTSVGSIGTVSSEFYIAHDSTVDSGLRFRNGIIQPCNASGGSNPDAVSLGQISMRFSDLWLSGGAYLGGTASANKLDDYEEGTWTPEYEATTAFTSITYDSVTYGKYTKVGNLVHIQGIIRTDSISGGSGTVTLTGLPFTVGAAQFSSISLGYVNSFAGDSPGGMYVIGNGTSVSIRYRTTANGGLDNSLAVGDLDTGANKNYLAFGGTYITTA
jgi:hypothetical protein